MQFSTERCDCVRVKRLIRIAAMPTCHAPVFGKMYRVPTLRLVYAQRILRIVIWSSVIGMILVILRTEFESDWTTDEASESDEQERVEPKEPRHRRPALGKGSARLANPSNSDRRYPKLSSQRYFAPQVVDKAKTVIAYSAYIDFRNGNMGPAPAVRILALAKPSSHSALLCRFRFQNGEAIQNVTLPWYETPERHGTTYGTYVLSCVIPKGAGRLASQFTHVELLRSLQAKDYISIPISNHIIDDPSFQKSAKIPFKHTICAPTIFGYQYTNRHVIEYIEAHTIMGIDHFFFYVLDKDIDRYKKLLDFYQKQGRLTYFKMILPIDTASVWNYAQAVVAQDCVFRNAGYSRYLLLNDIDEYFVPYAADTWSEISATMLWKEPNRAGYRVPTYYFAPQTSQSKAERRYDDSEAHGKSFTPSEYPPPPVTITHTLATSKIDFQLSKCIIRPERVFDQGIYHVSRVIQHHYLVTILNESVAALHHFKNPLSTMTATDPETMTRTRLKELMEKDGRLRKHCSRVAKILRV